METEDKKKRDSKLRSIANTAKQLVSYSAVISWASGNHSGTFVPLFAIGKGAELFNGVIDNTDVPKLIKKAGRYWLHLQPVKRLTRLLTEQ